MASDTSGTETEKNKDIFNEKDAWEIDIEVFRYVLTTIIPFIKEDLISINPFPGPEGYNIGTDQRLIESELQKNKPGISYKEYNLALRLISKIVYGFAQEENRNDVLDRINDSYQEIANNLMDLIINSYSFNFLLFRFQRSHHFLIHSELSKRVISKIVDNSENELKYYDIRLAYIDGAFGLKATHLEIDEIELQTLIEELSELLPKKTED